MTLAFVLIILFYAVAFVFVVWPMHWLWHVRTKSTPYDKRFFLQPTFWKIYFWVFGTALLVSLVLNLLLNP